MKLFFTIVLSLLPNSLMAMECAATEAQFVGQVTDFFEYSDDYAQTGVCSFKIKFDEARYQESRLCPLPIQEAQNTNFTYDLRDQACPAAYNEQKLSGYLVKKDGVIFIDVIE